jgi:hypothetical protein
VRWVSSPVTATPIYHLPSNGIKMYVCSSRSSGVPPVGLLQHVVKLNETLTDSVMQRNVGQAQSRSLLTLNVRLNPSVLLTATNMSISTKWFLAPFICNSVRPFVCPSLSVWDNLAPTGRIFLKFYIGVIIIIIIIIIFSGSAAQRGLWPPRPRGFLITQRRATDGRTPLDE